MKKETERTNPLSLYAAIGQQHTEPDHTIYVLIRQDLTLTQQLVQASHASAEAGRRHYKPEHGIASLVVLSVTDEAALLAAAGALKSSGIASEVFFEPVDAMGHSSLASEPVLQAQRHHFRSWPLWKPESTAKGQSKTASKAFKAHAHLENIGSEKSFVSEMVSVD